MRQRKTAQGKNSLGSLSFYNLAIFKLKELSTTETEEKAMAAADVYAHAIGHGNRYDHANRVAGFNADSDKNENPYPAGRNGQTDADTDPGCKGDCHLPSSEQN